MSEANSEAGAVSRRAFLYAGGLAAAATNAPAIAKPLRPDSRSSAYSGGYLEAAKLTAKWIRSAAVDKEQGIAWLPEPDHPKKLTTLAGDNTIYSGSAGTLLFFVELAQATGDASYLHDARKAGDYLAATWRRPETLNPPAGMRAHMALSFDNGLSGTAFSLAELWKHTGDTKYRDAALAATAAIIDAAKPVGAGVEWAGSPSLSSDGSVALYLLYAARTFGDAKMLDVAMHAGHRILEKGVADPRGGTRWQGIIWPADQPPLPGIPANAWFPNFELGTAGVGYVLARIYEETRRPEFLEGARAAALHLRSIATVKGDAALIHYREPDLTDLYYLAYCHGPAGTSRLFYQLYKTTGDRQDLEWTEKLARGVMRSGIPEKQTPGLWNVACQCCGSAAVLDFFTSLSLVFERPEYSAFASRVADQLVSRETNFDGKGYRWYQAWTRTMPSEVTAETGYKIGAAGIGAALLHFDLAQRGHYRALLFPDNPFPSRHLA